jgi:hypothetical protein
MPDERTFAPQPAWARVNPPFFLKFFAMAALAPAG